MEENKIVTAEEIANKIDEDFYKENSYYLSLTSPQEFAEKVAIEFAKIHVKAALKAASEKTMLKVVNTEEFRNIEEGEDLVDSYECGSDVIHISVNSILNAYPDSNIK